MLQLGLAFFITLICYLIFPFIYLGINGKVDPKKGHKLALWNSIICAGIFFIFGIILGLSPTFNGSMFAPAFLYYFVAKLILVDKNKKETKKSVTIEGPYVKKISRIKNSNNEPINNKMDTLNIVTEELNTCPMCGNTINSNTKICEKCGSDISSIQIQKTKIFKTNVLDLSKKLCLYEKISIVTLIVLIVSIFIFIGALDIQHKNKISRSNYTSELLANINPSVQTYFQEIEHGYTIQYILYQKIDGQIVCYAFNMSTSSNHIGSANKADIISYFNNLIMSEPPKSFTCPVLLSFTIIIPILEFACIIILIVLFKKDEKELYNILVLNANKEISHSLSLKDNHLKYEKQLITKTEYFKNKKSILHNIVKNKFTFLL